jgi:hypothetical protein
MTLSPTDRRLYARRPLRAAVTFDAAGQTYRGSCHDLGKGGLSFLTEIDLPIGETFTLSILLTVGDAQARLTVKGVICWKQPAEPGPAVHGTASQEVAGSALARYGVAFSNLNPAQLKVLSEFLTGMGEPPMAKSRSST